MQASNMNGVLALAADVDRIMEQDGVKHRTALEQVRMLTAPQCNPSVDAICSITATPRGSLGQLSML